MAWVWSDELAAVLIEHDGVASGMLADWIHRPRGHALPAGVAPLEFARLLLASEREELRRVS
jgi:hypothetical protein